MSNTQTSKYRFLIIAIVAAFSLMTLAFIGIICLFWLVGMGMMTGRVADTKVLPGNKLPPRVVQTVSAAAGLAPGEQIIYFYSSAMTPDGDGNVLTDRRVISYVDNGTDAWCESIAIDDIVSVDFKKSDSWLDDSTIVVVSSDGSEITLYASNEGDGDTQFADAIGRAAKLDGK